VVEKQGLYIYTAAPRQIAKASNFCVDGWMDGRTNEGFFTKSVGREKELVKRKKEPCVPFTSGMALAA
jgi:hypothetical protein